MRSSPPRSDLPRAGARRRRRAAHARRDRRTGPGGAGLSALRPERRRPFRQDGPQRHRIRPDGGLCRGPQRPPPRQCRRRASRRPTPRRRRCAIPSSYRYDIDVAQVAEVWRRGSVVGSWLLDLTAAALRDEPRPWQIRTAACRIPARDAGRCRRRSTKACRRRCSARRCLAASARAARPNTPTS